MPNHDRKLELERIRDSEWDGELPEEEDEEHVMETESLVDKEAVKTSAQKTSSAGAVAAVSRRKFGWGPRFVALAAGTGAGAGFYINNHLDEFPEVKKFLGKADEAPTSTSVAKAMEVAQSAKATEITPPPVAEEPAPTESPVQGDAETEAQSAEGSTSEGSASRVEVKEQEVQSGERTELSRGLENASSDRENLPTEQVSLPNERAHPTGEQEDLPSERESPPSVAEDLPNGDAQHDELRVPGEDGSPSSVKGGSVAEEEGKEEAPAAEVVTSTGEGEQESREDVTEKKDTIPPEVAPETATPEEEEPVDPDTREGIMELERRRCRGLSTQELVEKIAEMTGRGFDEAAQVVDKVQAAEAEAKEAARAHYQEELDTVTDEMADMKLDFAERLDSIMSDHAVDVASLKGEVAALEVALNSLNEDKEAAMNVAFASQAAMSLSMDLMHDEGDVRGTIEEFTKLPSIRTETKYAVLDTLPSPMPPVYSPGALKVRFERQLPRILTSAFMPEKSSMMGTVMARVFASLYRLDRTEADEMKSEGADDAPEEFYRTSLLPFTDPTSKNLNSITRAARCLDKGDLPGAVCHLRSTTGTTRAEINEWLTEAASTLEVWQAVDVLRGDLDSAIASH
ncbi:hypothetical protein FOZ63_033921 [Perkinsus olseni]|uniref:MICOS complex subunit MIC60 n=1 Tax=Perkinsus olseni TaxID=32597 RepID=A0A7J6T502_PEROL|nr:hypothetical protein FOZ63_033921 [Perkinsus olseni]